MSILTLIALFVLTGCGSASSSGSTAGRPAADASPAAGGGEAGTANGESPTRTYTNSRFKYSVDGPGTMTEATDGSAAYLGAAERLEITVVKDASAADPHRRAIDDLSGLAASKPAFKVVDSLSHGTLAGRGVEKVVFSWTDGVSAVTGKPNDLVSARYYVAKDRSTLAVITYSIAANQYDPQGADDIASTFRWL
jgi:hypothetical protein